MDNIMVLVDLAESYNVHLLKDKCDNFLTNMVPTAENVFKICETLKIYSLQNALDNMYEFIAINATTLLKTPNFLNTTKDIVLDIVKMERLVIKEEELFDAVYKWAEYQHMENKAEENSVSIKDLLSDILPHIRFPVMDIEYLHTHIVPLGYLFSSFSELSQILRDAGSFQKKTLVTPVSKYPYNLRKSFNIQLKDDRGNLAYAYIFDTELIKRIFDLTQGRPYPSNNYHNSFNQTVEKCFWNVEVQKLTSKNVVCDIHSCKIYLIRNSQGKLALKDFSPAQNLEQVPARHRNVFWDRYAQAIFNDNELIARVYCDNESFVVGYGCSLKVVFSEFSGSMPNT